MYGCVRMSSLFPLLSKKRNTVLGSIKTEVRQKEMLPCPGTKPESGTVRKLEKYL
jgi:hypothetical protein